MVPELTKAYAARPLAITIEPKPKRSGTGANRGMQR
jgi:hypothetical protein